MSRNVSKFRLFWGFPRSKIISKAVFSSDVWWQQWKSNCIVSPNFLAQKTIGKKNIVSLSLFQEMSLKREIFVNFLPQKKIWKNMALFQHILWLLCLIKFWHVSSVTHRYLHVFRQFNSKLQILFSKIEDSHS